MRSENILQSLISAITVIMIDMRSDIEAVVQSMENEKSHGIDNIPTELIHAGDNKWIDVITAICISIWKTGPKPWTQLLVIILPKKRNL